MASFQQFIILGNLTKDPERRVTNNGMSVAEFCVAVNSQRDGEMPFYADTIAFGKVADNVCSYLRKGSSVFLIGKLKTEKWTDKNTGAERQRTRVYADSVHFLSYKKDVIPPTTSIDSGLVPASDMFNIIEKANNPNPFAKQVPTQIMNTPKMDDIEQDEIPF